ncbi:MAG: YicC family protein [Rhodobacterales bacterium CG2_30_65_12]|nr:MAG: YicC family protein [Rhodobacterales bacterium CG2_30_65_12]
MILSMTGFASLKGAHGPWSWAWDIRSVNGRGLDLRLKLPDWIEGLEVPVRKALGEAITRGNVSVGLRLTREAGAGALALDRAALERSLALLAEIGHAAEARGIELARPSAVEIAAMRGVLDASPQEEDITPLRAALLAALPALIAAFNQMRSHEGAALGVVLTDQLAVVEALVGEALAAVEARRAAQGQALRTALARVIDNSEGIDEARVAQELALIAVKSDVREEIDRLTAHVAQARALLAGAEARGRKLDFLMQEFNREANTLCSKSQFPDLTRIGLDLKALIDQMREQVQNVE